MPPKTAKTKSSPKGKPSRRRPGSIAPPRRSSVPSAEEELFAKAFRSSPHPIGITELESGRCLEVNDACLEIFGFRRDEVVGHTTLMLGIWPDPQERVRLIDRLKSEGTVRNLEVSMRMKNGNLRQFLILTDLIVLNGKQCLLTMGNDITERKQAEEALRQSEERWQLAATGTTDGIWDWDVAGHTVFLSERWKQLRGYREEEIGVDETEWSSRIHPEDLSRVLATVQSYFNKEIPTFDCEYRTRRKDGTYFWICDRGIAVWDAQGRVVRMVGSETDITERKRAEAELRHSEEQFRTVVESAPNGILSVDGGGRIVLVNGQIERQFGYRREELIGHPVERLLPGRFRRDHAGLREAYQEDPEARAMGRGRDLYGLRKDGSELPVEIGLSPIETISGTMVLASVVDITERKQREHALAEQRRLYKTVTDNATLALFIMDDRQQCVFMNPAAEALTGFALAEVMGRPLHDVVHHTRPDGSHYPLSECPIDQAFPKNDLEQGEEVFVHKDGHFYHVAFTASPIRNELGRPVGTVIEVQDITQRKEAEAALRESEERFRTMAQAVPSFLFETDAAGWNVWTSEGWCRFTGQTPEQVAGHGWAEALHPDDRAANIDRWAQCMKDGVPFEAQQRLRRTDGTYAWVIARALPVRDDQGTIRRWVGSVTNVDDIVLAQEALREREERLRYHVSNAGLAVIEWDAQWLVTRWEGEAERMFGWTAEEMLGRRLPDLKMVYDDDIPHVQQVMAQLSDGVTRMLVSHNRNYTKSGRVIHCIWHNSVLLGGEGRLSSVLSLVQDNTAQVEAEAALRELNQTLEQRVTERTGALRKSEKRFRTFLGNAPNVAFMKARDGRYLYVNRRFEEAFQLEQNEIVGKTDAELFSREQAEQFHGHDRAVFEAGTAVEFEETALYADGRHTNIVLKFPVRDGAGHVYAIGGIVTDITDRKKIELALQQNQRVLQEQRQELQRLTEQLFLAQDRERQRIARDLHDDFSQRLAAVAIDVASLQRRPPRLAEMIGEALEPVREELQQLTNDLHDLAYRLHPSPLRHLGLQAAIEDHIDKAIERTGLRISLKAKDVPDSIPLDWSICLFRVFQESLQNVAKHAKATEVLVKLTGSSNGFGLSVIDNGKGFDVCDKRGHQKGLGLISMRERLRLLNGFLNIHSRPTDGTKVCAWIPFKEQTP